jgi:hypothetical protein
MLYRIDFSMQTFCLRTGAQEPCVDAVQLLLFGSYESTIGSHGIRQPIHGTRELTIEAAFEIGQETISQIADLLF